MAKEQTTTPTETTDPPSPTTQTATPRERRTLSQVIGARNPDNDAILEEIKDQLTTITAFSSEDRQGKRRKYKVSTITLEDGRTFTVVGNGVAGPLGYLEPEDFPIDVTFRLLPSDFGEGEYYWSVE